MMILYPKILSIRFFTVPHTIDSFASFGKPFGNICKRFVF